MELSTITACKLFKTSNRQDKILANVANVCSSGGLQIQQARQVNKDSLPKHLKRKEKHKEKQQKDDLKKREFSRSAKQSALEEGPSSSAEDVKHVKHTPMHTDSKAPVENKPENKSKSASEHTPEPSETNAVESSTCVSMPRIDVTEHMDAEVEDIKGILNADASTCGANRVRSKDGEVWVYYNDSVNLNDVMVNVIETLNRAGYTYLEFNRLARSDNAVVFVIISEDTEREKKSEQQVNSEG